ncbi:hypothetical protein CT19425_U380030 [Cupriavidus taiwanensis]|uniref:Uncharacterized protein n=1 Tax=Cupriavidus taiwanensis TaxID=164546 RepID=A0A375I5T9_9BURK|nr:hypothetical protein CT19425_U380030 [Cupriavidus taiwanensis]
MPVIPNAMMPPVILYISEFSMRSHSTVVRHVVVHVVLHPAKSMPLRVDGQIVIATLKWCINFFAMR